VILPWRGVRARRAIDRYLRLCQPLRRRRQKFRYRRRSEPWKISVKGLRVATRPKAAKLRVWRGCQGCIGWRCVEGVSAEAGAGEEAQLGPFAELGEQVAGLDLQAQG
jgi:hypothetical protein